jgi:hypothetical protein
MGISFGPKPPVAAVLDDDPALPPIAPPLPPVALPPVALPPVALPPVALPPVALPPVALPPVALPLVALPPVALPPVALPPVALPPVVLPPVALPPVALPPVVLPPVALPDPPSFPSSEFSLFGPHPQMHTNPVTTKNELLIRCILVAAFESRHDARAPRGETRSSSVTAPEEC